MHRSRVARTTSETRFDIESRRSKAAILQKLKPQGTLIISGIRNNQKDLAVNTFKEDGLDLILELNTNEWNALVLRDRETSSHT